MPSLEAGNTQYGPSDAHVVKRAPIAHRCSSLRAHRRDGTTRTQAQRDHKSVAHGILGHRRTRPRGSKGRNFGQGALTRASVSRPAK
jgi:hypothetical protein